MSFNVKDDFDDEDIIIPVGEDVVEVTTDSLHQFFGMTDEKPEVTLVLTGRDEKSRVAEINAFVLNRIVEAIVDNNHKREWVIRHAAKTLDILAKQGGVTLNKSESNAIGLYKKAKQTYAFRELTKAISDLNAEYGSNTTAVIQDSDKPRFTGALFNSLAEKVNESEPTVTFVYKAGRKEETVRLDAATGFDAVNSLNRQILDIKKAAKKENRELTDEEHTEIELLREERGRVWSRFFENAKTILANANKAFPEQIGTARTTTSGVWKSVSTMDTINFGAFEL